MGSAISKSKSVCEYISDAFNHAASGYMETPQGYKVFGDRNAGDLITTPRGYVMLGDQKIELSASPKYHDPGFPSAESYLWFRRKEDSSGKLPDDMLHEVLSLPGFKFYEPEKGSLSPMSIVPYRGKYYVALFNAGRKPFKVYEPSEGLVCTF